MESQDEEYLNNLRYEVPSDSIMIKSVPGLDPMPEIAYFEEQHVPSTL